MFNILIITRTKIAVTIVTTIINIYHYMYHIGIIRAHPEEGHKDALKPGAPLL